MHRSDPLSRRVRDFLKAHHLETAQITAALSGGADSVCLLHVLHQLYEGRVRAIHIQHNLRGEESLRDEQFCRDLCQKLGIPLTVVSCDAQGYAKAHHMSIETAARECRYAAFAEHCEGYVATAHTASDQLETILQRITRGTGLKGLCGIPAVREQFFRPLLQVTREEVEAYLQEHGLSYVTDSTNAEDTYRRNFIRHQVVPHLKACNPSIEKNCAEMTQLLADEEDYLEEQAKIVYQSCLRADGCLKDLAQHHPAIQRRCIAMLLETHGLASRYHILKVQELLTKGGSVELVRGGLCAHVSRGYLQLMVPRKEFCQKLLQIGENCIYDGVYLKAEVIPRANADLFSYIHTMFANYVLDYDIISRNAMLHSRIPGLRLETKRGSVSIKKWLGAEIVPSHRDYVHYLSDESGLLWVEGLGSALRVRVTEQTENLLYLYIITK